MQQVKFLRAEHSWRNPINALQEAIHYSFKNFAFTIFPSGKNSLCTTPQESKKLSTWSWDGTFGFSIFFGWGDVSPTQSELYHFVLGSRAKHQVSSPTRILLKKKFLSASAITIMSWQDTTRSSLCKRCQGVWNKTCAQLSPSQILFQNLKNYSLGDVQRICYHSWCNSMVILTKSATAAIYTSVWVDFGSPPLSSSTSSLLSQNLECHLKTFDRFRASFPQVFCTNTSVSVADRPALKQNFMATLCSFLPSMTYKGNWLYKASYNSYIVKDKQTKLSVWTDVSW